MAILLLSVAWDDFPAMLAFYAVMTGYSILLGIGCLQSSGYAPVWEEQGISREAQKQASGILGVLYLLNAAVCPLGWLLAQFIEFDTDFILLAQIIGLPLIALLTCAPLLFKKNK